MSLIDHQPMPYADYAYPQWAIAVGWLIVMSSLSFIPGYFIYILIITPGTFLEVRCFFYFILFTVNHLNLEIKKNVIN